MYYIFSASIEDNLIVSGSLSVSQSISASIFSGSFVGNGSGITGVTAVASASGITGNVQYNLSGALGSTSSFFYDVNAGTLVIGSSAFPNSKFHTDGNINSYIQNNIQNDNSGTSASADWVVTANNGNDTTNYGDFGINSSTYSDPLFSIYKPNSVYLYSQADELVIGTRSVKDMIFHAGGTTIADRAMVVRSSGSQKGYVGFLEGTTSNPTLLGKIHIVNEVDASGSFFADRYSSTVSPFLTLRRARGTVASPTAVQSNDSLGGIGWRGYGTTGFSANTRANILVRASQIWTDNNQGTNLSISLTPSNSTGSFESIRSNEYGLIVSQSNATVSGSTGLLTVVGGTMISQSGATELTDVNFRLRRTLQRVTGAVPTQRAVILDSPTYSFTGASTITTAATLAISGSPQAGTNATITNSHSLWIQTGSIRYDLGTGDATGDIYYRNISGSLQRLGIGADTQVLLVNGNIPSWGSVPQSGSFGNSYNYLHDNFETAYADANKNLATRLTTPSLTSGTYRLQYYCELQMLTTTMQPTVTAEYSGTVFGTFVGRTVNTANYFPLFFFTDVTISGIHTLDIYYQGSNTSTGRIRNRRVSIFRVA